jgi:hypothetical protein
MSFAVDLPLLIDFVAACGDDFGLERQVAARNADAIELQLEISLAPEVAWILGCFEMADEIATARKSLLTELGDSAQVAKNGIPDIDGGRGEVRFVEGTLQKSTSGQDDIPCAGAQAQRKDNEA